MDERASFLGRARERPRRRGRPYLRDVVATCIRELGHTVEAVAAGGRLLVALTQAVKGAGTLPDLIVSDVRMPVMTGLSMAIAVAALDHRIPVILLTAFPDEELTRRVQQLSGVELLGKPFEPETLQRLVRARVSTPRRLPTPPQR